MWLIRFKQIQHFNYSSCDISHKEDQNIEKINKFCYSCGTIRRLSKVRHRRRCTSETLKAQQQYQFYWWQSNILFWKSIFVIVWNDVFKSCWVRSLRDHFRNEDITEDFNTLDIKIFNTFKYLIYFLDIR